MNAETIINHLQSAFDFRESLALNTNAMRLVNGRGDGLDGLIIDRYNKHFVVYLLEASWQPHKETISKFLCEHFDVQYLICKDRSVSTPCVDVLVSKENSQTIVEENGLKFHVDLNDHLNQGLFLDMRKNRKLVASYAKDKAVLNCFAYTCSFGVYARKFGAARVTNVDISSKVLQKGKENYRLNHLHEGRSEFVQDHAVEYMQRVARRNNFFDIIVLDPPSFSRYEGKAFSVKKDMPLMIEKALLALNPSGILFVSTNLSTISRPQMEEWTRAAAKKLKRKVVEVSRLSQDIDFRGSGLMKESFLSALLVKME